MKIIKKFHIQHEIIRKVSIYILNFYYFLIVRYLKYK
jgi:hypothetical protein